MGGMCRAGDSFASLGLLLFNSDRLVLTRLDLECASSRGACFSSALQPGLDGTMAVAH